jgi:hypothetical protein
LLLLSIQLLARSGEERWRFVPPASVSDHYRNMVVCSY